MVAVRRQSGIAGVVAVLLVTACSPSTPSGTPYPAGTTPDTTATQTRAEYLSEGGPVVTGRPIKLADLSGRIVTDDFEDVFAMDIDGSTVVTVAGRPGAEFDGAWSPDGKWVVYRDSTRGINDNDEIFIARADGSQRRNLTKNPANDWGPDWSPDGSTIAFNSDRNGRMAGFLVNADGSDLRPMPIDAWVEYPSFSPDGTQISFMGSVGGENYEIYVGDLGTGAVTRLTDTPGSDAWPAWSPDGSTIAFSSQRDDCEVIRTTPECWRAGPDDEHRDVWLISPDGLNLRRVTTEIGQFVTWSPDSRYLLISGRALYVVRPDGTGRLELRADGRPLALGGIPDWR